MATAELIAQKREDLRGSSTKAMRKSGNTPGIFYYKGKPSVPIYVKDNALRPFVFTSEVKIINLKIEGENNPLNCILKDVQFDPVSDKPVHFDLLGISENEKIKIEIPVQIIGSAAGVKDGGLLQHSIHKLEVECFPKDIPSHIEVDVTELKIGDSIQVKDIPAEQFVILDNPDLSVISVIPPTVEKAPEEAAVEGETSAESAEPEVISKGKKEEEDEKQA